MTVTVLQKKILSTQIAGTGIVNMSSKGLVNGLSEYFNDGAQFGPDTLGTQSTGFLEAWNYATANEYQDSVGQWYMPQIMLPESITITEPITLKSPNELIEIAIHGRPLTFTQINCELSSSGYAITIDQNAVQNNGFISFNRLFQAANTKSGFIYYNNTRSSPTIQVSIENCNWGQVSASGIYGMYLSGVGNVYTNRTIDASPNGSYFNINGNDNSGATFIATTFLYSLTIGNAGGGQISNVSFDGTFSSEYNMGYITTLGPISNMLINNCNIVIGNTSGIDYLIDATNGTVINLVIKNSPTNVKVNPAYIVYPVSNVNIVSLDFSSGLTLNGNTLNYPEPQTPTLSTNPPVSGTVYQNTNNYPIEIDMPVYATTSGTAGYVTIVKGPSTGNLTGIASQYVSGDTTSTATQIITLRVPTGWYYKFVSSGVTFGTASVFAD